MPDQLWGGETSKAVENFPVSGETMPIEVVRWLARIKGASATATRSWNCWTSGAARSQAAGEIVAGKHDDQFPIDVFQTGSGTSSNMNVNEVIATLAGDNVHANDHVNMGQSSNDVFPSAVHLAALEATETLLLPSLTKLERAFTQKSKKFEDIVKSGRTHLMDAVPVTLGQEFAATPRRSRLGACARALRAAPRGADPARRHRDRHRPEHASEVRRAGAARAGARG